MSTQALPFQPEPDVLRLSYNHRDSPLGRIFRRLTCPNASCSNLGFCCRLSMYPYLPCKFWNHILIALELICFVNTGTPFCCNTLGCVVYVPCSNPNDVPCSINFCCTSLILGPSALPPMGHITPIPLTHPHRSRLNMRVWLLRLPSLSNRSLTYPNAYSHHKFNPSAHYSKHWHKSEIEPSCKPGCNFWLRRRGSHFIDFYIDWCLYYKEMLQ